MFIHIMQTSDANVMTEINWKVFVLISPTV